MGEIAAEGACERCKEPRNVRVDPKRLFLLVAPGIDQANLWRRRHDVAGGQVRIADTFTGCHPHGLHPDGVEVVFLDGWRRGRYADRLVWTLGAKGFDVSAARCVDPDPQSAPRGISPRATPARRRRAETLVGQSAGQLGDKLVDELPDRCELALVTVSAVVRRPDGSLTTATQTGTAGNTWGLYAT